MISHGLDWNRMSINGKFDNLTRQDLLTFAIANNIRHSAEIIDRVCDCAARWSNIARNCGVPQNMINYIETHILLNI